MTEDEAQSDKCEVFVQHVADCQAPLYGYAMQLLADSEAAREVVAEANVTLWRKRDEFTLGTSFFAWASRIVYYEVMAYRKRASRDRLRFDDDLLQLLADNAHEVSTGDSRVFDALEKCLDATSPQDRELLERRYVEGCSAREIAADCDRSPHAISQALYRIRMSLLNCMNRALSASEQS